MIYYSRTHSDIGFAASKVRQFMHSPGQEHFEATYRILKCLKGTCGKGLLFKRHGQVHVEVFTDVDWAGSIIGWKSTSGYCACIGGILVIWRSKKYNVVARSDVEAELRSVAHEICEVCGSRGYCKT